MSITIGEIDLDNLDQEIEWIREEIESDEGVMDSSDASGFHKARISENEILLRELLELQIKGFE